MKLKNTLGLVIASFSRVVVEAPVIQLERRFNGNYEDRVEVGGREITRVRITHESVNGMLAMKHAVYHNGIYMGDPADEPNYIVRKLANNGISGIQGHPDSPHRTLTSEARRLARDMIQQRQRMLPSGISVVDRLVSGGLRRSEFMEIRSAETPIERSRVRGFVLSDLPGDRGVVVPIKDPQLELLARSQLAVRRLAKRYEYTASGMIPDTFHKHYYA